MAETSGSTGSALSRDRRLLHSEDAERGVLGSILLDYQKVLDFCQEKQLTAESFYMRAHQTVYAAMEDMHRALKPIDLLTLADRLASQNSLDEVGGTAYLNRLLDSTPTAAHAEYYIDIVRQNHLLRRVVDCARQAENECYAADDADLALAKVEQSFFALSENRHGTMMPWPQTVKDAMGTINRILESKKGISGIPTGYKKMDETLLGMHNGEMIVLAARPSMGKTSLAMNIAENVALGRGDNPPRGVAIFSLEMSREQLVMRLLSSHARIPMHSIAGGYITVAQHGLLMQAADLFMKAPIVLDDTGGLDITELRARARRMKQKYDIKLVVIDYLQLMHSDHHRRDGRQVEVSFISNSIKSMAKELGVPVLVLSQLNRAPDKERDGKPRLADLRESGSIEQDADIVLLLRRPAYYNKDEDNKDSDPTLAIVEVAKNRNGPTTDMELTFLGELMRFENRASVAVYGDGPSGGGAA